MVRLEATNEVLVPSKSGSAVALFVAARASGQSELELLAAGPWLRAPLSLAGILLRQLWTMVNE